MDKAEVPAGISNRELKEVTVVTFQPIWIYRASQIEN